jgi:broad specificity phosphatase PhoE
VYITRISDDRVRYYRVMKLYLARHGRTNYNDHNLCNADPSVDVHLTEAGIMQAKALADKLQRIPIDHIFVSELKRTQQTAEIVNATRNIPAEIAPLLNDHRSGFESKSAQLLMEALDASDDRWNARFNDGESIEDMKARAATFLAELRNKPYESVLIITSGWVIYVVLAIILNISNEEAWLTDIEQGSYIEVSIL